jgi:tungstate transport system substrate-binding protein
MMERSTMGRRRLAARVGALALAALVGVLAASGEAQQPLFIGVTTSTENSGLLAHVLDAFEADHDVTVRAVTAGSGAVLNLAARGDVDAILTHAPADEEALLAAGFGIDRRPVMENRFVIVGPSDDPANVRGAASAAKAMAAIAESGAIFLSRGDESGTHRAEQALWRAAGGQPAESGVGWYRESGSGQGATLNIAANLGAYVLTDEATWATFGNRGDLDVLFSQDEPSLRNVYSVIRVNPERYSMVNAEDALTFADWLTSAAGQAAIRSFKANGRALFRPAADLAG